MASWLRTEQADDFVERLRGSYAAARGRVSERLRTDLGFPSYAVHPGTCSAYLRFRVPTRYVHEGSEARYRRLCLQAGVLPGAGSMTGPRLGPRRRRDPSEAYVRLFLAQPGCVLDEALDRLARAGLGW